MALSHFSSQLGNVEHCIVDLWLDWSHWSSKGLSIDLLNSNAEELHVVELLSRSDLIQDHRRPQGVLGETGKHQLTLRERHHWNERLRTQTKSRSVSRTKRFPREPANNIPRLSHQFCIVTKKRFFIITIKIMIIQFKTFKLSVHVLEKGKHSQLIDTRTVNQLFKTKTRRRDTLGIW